MFQDKAGKRNLIILMVILVGFSTYYMFYSQPNSSMAFNQKTAVITFYGPKNTSASFDLHELTSLKLVTEPDLGNSDGGGKLFGDNLYGTWKSSSLGVYQAFVTLRINSYIVISDAEKTAAFNYSDDETVASLYQQLEKFRQDLS